jgi:diguanylate cyclase (GGDEF)-like protein/PAS domain S-box-containing protein
MTGGSALAVRGDAAARAFWPVAAAFGLLLVAYAATSGSLAADVLQDAISMLGAGVVLWALRTRRLALRGPWILIGIGVAISAAADVVYTVVAHLDGSVPDVSPLDAAYLVGTALIVAGAVRFTALKTHARDREGVLDALTVLAAVTVVTWEAMLEPALSASQVSALARGVSIAYPVLDIVMLSVFARLAIDGRYRSPVTLLLGAGALATFLADFVYALQVQDGDYSLGSSAALELAWALFYVFFALAALSGSATEQHDDRRPDGPTIGLSRVVLSSIALASPGIAAAIGQLQGEPLDLAMDLSVQAVLIALVALRLGRLARYEAASRNRLARREAYFAALAQNSSDIVMITDGHGVIQHASVPVERILGYDPERLRGMNALEFAIDDELPRAVGLLEEALSTPGRTVTAELLGHAANGTQVWLGARVTNLLDDPAVRGIVLHLHDVTARKQAEAELSRQAFYDSLTGLTNRALFNDRLRHAFAGRAEQDVAVLYVDLDRFKYVNDSLGHQAGDRLLKTVGARLARVIRPEDTVARLGGDEFAVLLEGLAPDEPATAGTGRIDTIARRAEAIAQRILAEVADPVELDGSPVVVTASIGIAVAADGARDVPDDLLRDADMALYAAKSLGRNRFAFYAPDMRSAAVERLHLEADLRRALAGEQLRVHYQPIVDLDGTKLIGFEALLRWEHPTRGLVYPNSFIPIAEDTGLIVPIGAWVLQQACASAARWNRNRDEALAVWVNVSGRQLQSDRLVDDVADALATSGVDPDHLILELTETALVQNVHQAVPPLARIKSLGAHVAVDDFGTGYSSLSYLRELPVDIVKIDRSFVESIDAEHEMPGIVRGILGLSHTMGMRTVGEGIETREQLDLLRSEGCDLGQGFVFARPLEEHAADELARGRVHLQELVPTHGDLAG